MRPSTPFRVGPGHRGDAEAGAILVFVAILIPVLFAVAGIAVDVSRWYVEVQRVQRAADAAALAAAPYMPDSLTSSTSKAVLAAEAELKRNGFDPADYTIDSDDLRETEVRVTLSSTIPNGFGPLLGVPETTITRSGVGEFTGPAPTGSPCNVHGNEPVGVGDQSQIANNAICDPEPEFWPSVYGPEVYKTQGDQFSTRWCGRNPWIESGCDGTDRGAANDEFDPRGYAIAIKIREDLNAPLRIELFDPAYVDTGGYRSSTGRFCPAIPSITNDSPNRYVRDARDRYDPDGGEFCSGDGDNSGLRFPEADNNAYSTEVPTITSFGVIKANDTLNPFDKSANDNNRIGQCTRQFPGFSKDGDGDGSWSAKDDRVDLDDSDDASDQLSADNALTEVFHRWVTLCDISGAKADDVYYLRVRSNVPLGTEAVSLEYPHGKWTNDGVFGFDDDGSVKGNGGNRFAVRAYSPGRPDSRAKVSVSAYSDMTIFANTTAANTEFQLVQVVPQRAGGLIEFSFFDIGDAEGDGTLTVLPPLEATVGGLPFDAAVGCTKQGYLKGVLQSTNPVPATNCSIDGIAGPAGYNGQRWDLTIPIPQSYSCDETDDFGCWWRLAVDFSADVHDQTTWTVNISGDPVRLTE